MAPLEKYLLANVETQIPVTITLDGGTWSMILETIEVSVARLIADSLPGMAEELGDVRDIIMMSIPIPENNAPV